MSYNMAQVIRRLKDLYKAGLITDGDWRDAEYEANEEELYIQALEKKNYSRRYPK